MRVKWIMSQRHVVLWVIVINAAGAAPPIISASASAMRVRDGQSMQLTCPATGQPKPLIYWFKGNGSYAPPSDRDVRINKSVAAFILLHDSIFFAVSTARTRNYGAE